MEKYYFKTSKILAEGYYQDGNMKILKGSFANKEVLSSFPDSLLKIRSQLINNGVLIEKGDKLVFSQDYLCSSPSQASALINASTSNGLLAWKDSSGRTLKSRLRELE